MARGSGIKIRTVLLLSSAVVFAIFAVMAGLLVRSNMQRVALDKARHEAEILLTHNLAIHTYFTEKLKPAVLSLARERLADGYFEPAWMSSTFAVREIQQAAQQELPRDYYYKECAIDARSPENEADPVEREFLQQLNRNPHLVEKTSVRTIDGRRYFVVMRRGEKLEQDCLLCHSTPEAAPPGLIARYGDRRSFHREVGETISALSVRVPLSETDTLVSGLSWRLSFVLICVAGALFAVIHLIYRNLLLQPILTIRNLARRIARDERYLGETLPAVRGRELKELAAAFDEMSGQLRANHDDLEKRVETRTAELNRALDQLQASEERYRTLNRSMIQPLALHEIICDGAGTPIDYRFLDVNPAFEELLGKSADDIIGRTVRELLPETEPRWIEAFGKVALTREPLHFEDYAQSLDRHFDVVAYSPRQGQFAVIATDISERVRMRDEKRRFEEQMYQVQKLESLGVLAGGIAHDFNNILMSVLGNTDLALMRLPAESPATENLRQIEAAAGQATDLARQMLAYSGKGRFVVEPLNLNRVIEEMLHILQVSISKQAVLRCNYSPQLPAVEADATQLRQVLMNLVLNASEAVGERSGVIAISTGAMDCDRSYLQETCLGQDLGEDLPAGLYVYFEVADTGCGMDQKTLRQIFDPFFTTKFTGRGLGMAAVLGIVRGHGGTIKVYSEPGAGTTFKVLLPAAARAEAPADPANGTAPRWRGEGTVLLVDDEETVRAVGRDMLQELGFSVLTAGDGREALEIFRENRDRIRCVLMDLTMPHMDGEEAFRELRRLEPGIPIIMASGYNEQEVSQRFLGKGLSGFLQKPYRITALQEALRNLEAADKER